MKLTTIGYLAFLFLLMIFITLSSQYNYREGLNGMFDNNIITSNIQNGPLTGESLIHGLNWTVKSLSNTSINKINIVNNPNFQNNFSASNDVTTISINGNKVGTVSEVTKNLSEFINRITGPAQSIDIQFQYNES
jgi:hypothetical protein